MPAWHFYFRFPVVPPVIWVRNTILKVWFLSKTFYLLSKILGPGGAQDNYKNANCTGGAASYIDQQIFGLEHMYKHPSSMRIYDSKVPFDPEGFLGSLSSAFLVFLGVQCGYTLLTFSEWQPRLRRWLLWGFVLGVIAGGLCGFSKEEGVVPLNKNLWSLSFSLALGSFAFILLSVM